jgi:aminopeptidase-like protein
MPSLRDIRSSLRAEQVGHEMHALIARLYPICRSMTGDGVRQTLAIIKEHIPLTIREVPSGTRVFDWTVPQEWNIKDAYVKNSKGEKVVDFKRSNLHVVNFSSPVHQTMDLSQLKDRIFTLPDQPDSIPYRTSFFKESWGFCMSHNEMKALEPGRYEVFVDSSIKDGHLTYGELFIKGDTADEVLISTHVCHPSLCNDNLSGISVATMLAKNLAAVELKHSYRFLFIPTTIGSITWLSQNEDKVPRIKHGLVLACLGDAGKSTYKKSRRGDADIDRAVMHVLKHSGKEFVVNDFIPYGYDERQFCSPGFDLPVGCLTRTPHGLFPEYHTSADNLTFVQPAFLADSFSKCLTALSIIECNGVFRNLNPKCEPQLGRRGIYRPYAEQRTDGGTREMAMLWVLNQSDGQHALLDIAEKCGLNFDVIKEAADILLSHDLLKEQLQ